MGDGGVVVHDQANGSVAAEVVDVPLRVHGVGRVLLLREEEERVVVVAPERLVVDPPVQVPRGIDDLVDDEFLRECRHGARGDRVERRGQGQIVLCNVSALLSNLSPESNSYVCASAIVGVGPCGSTWHRTRVCMVVVHDGQCVGLFGQCTDRVDVGAHPVSAGTRSVCRHEDIGPLTDLWKPLADRLDNNQNDTYAKGDGCSIIWNDRYVVIRYDRHYMIVDAEVLETSSPGIDQPKAMCLSGSKHKFREAGIIFTGRSIGDS